MIVDVAKAVAVVFLAALLQVTIFATIEVAGGTPDLLLVTLIAVGLLRGSIFGAIGGFFAGLMVDTATLGMLGLTSLLLTLVGYGAGRYGETTGRDRAHAPIVAAVVLSILYAFGELALRYLLGESSSARVLFDTLLPGTILNMLLVVPVFAVCRRLLRPFERTDRAREVHLLG